MEKEREKEKESRFAKYIGLYMSQVHQQAKGYSDKKYIDTPLPFKLFWDLISFPWRWFRFRNEKETKAKAGEKPKLA